MKKLLIVTLSALAIGAAVVCGMPNHHVAAGFGDPPPVCFPVDCPPPVGGGGGN